MKCVDVHVGGEPDQVVDEPGDLQGASWALAFADVDFEQISGLDAEALAELASEKDPCW
jgi:hypothetical protein